jgi:hypothetical protein
MKYEMNFMLQNEHCRHREYKADITLSDKRFKDGLFIDENRKYLIRWILRYMKSGINDTTQIVGPWLEKDGKTITWTEGK